MNLKRTAVTALATAGTMTTGAAPAGPASADPEPYPNDPRTRAEPHKFQSAHGLPVTGRLDARTWNKLIATPAGK